MDTGLDLLISSSVAEDEMWCGVAFAVERAVPRVEVVPERQDALQCLMVSPFAGPGIRVLMEADAKELWEANERGDADAMLKGYDVELFLGFYERTKKERHTNLYFHSKAFKPSRAQTRSDNRLNALRNDFIRFVPKSSLVAIENLPLVVNDCTNIM